MNKFNFWYVKSPIDPKALMPIKLEISNGKAKYWRSASTSSNAQA